MSLRYIVLFAALLGMLVPLGASAASNSEYLSMPISVQLIGPGLVDHDQLASFKLKLTNLDKVSYKNIRLTFSPGQVVVKSSPRSRLGGSWIFATLMPKHSVSVILTLRFPVTSVGRYALVSKATGKGGLLLGWKSTRLTIH